jgi:putative hydrolase of the HAD superfamily
MAIRAVTLDAGGTLITVAEPVGETYARIAARHGVRIGAGDAERGFREAFATAPPLAFPGASPTRLRNHERAWWYTVVRRALGRAAAGPAGDAAFDELFAHYAGASAWRVFPEVPDVLATLRARGLALAVVSNFDARLGPLLDALGLAPWLDAIVHSSRAGSAKPDAGIFRDALARLGVAPADALHAGDDLAVDVLGARAAGMRAALVNRGASEPTVPADVPVLGSLEELPGFLDQQLPAA